jgi:cytochrome c oxidase subunit 3
MLWLSTGIIALSSVCFEVARRRFGSGQYANAAFLLRLTGVLGLAFLLSQAKAWLELIDRGAYMESNPYSGFFYLFTGLHAAHLLGGFVGIGIAIFSTRRRREVVDAAAFYWHFLGILWAALFFVLAH